MAPNPKVVRAFRAMKDIGIPEEKVKPVLKNLLKVYEKNWELIEEENYRALADAIFETEEAQEAENKKKLVNTERGVDFEEESQVHEEPERPLKRLRLRHQEGQPSPSVSNSSSSLGGVLLKKPKVEGSDLNSENPRIESEPVSPQSLSRKKGKQPVSPNSQPSISPIRLRDRGKEPVLPQNASGEKRATSERPSNAVVFKEPKVEPGITLSPKQKVPAIRALIKPKDEPVTDGIPQFEVPIAVIHPEPLSKGNSSIANGSNGESHGPEPLTSQSTDAVDTYDEIAAPSIETGPSCELAKIPDESSANLEIASSPSGEVKISLTCNSALGRPDFHMPSLDSVLKAMEDKCLRSYKVLDPKFSVTKLMKDMCECFLELGTEPNNESQETLNVTPTNDMLEKYCAVEAVGTEGSPSRPSNGSDNIQCDAEVVLPQIPRLPPPCNSVDDHVQPDKYSSADDGEIDIVLPQIPRVPLPCNSVDDHVQPDTYSSADDGEIDTVLPQLPRLPPPCNGVDDHVQPEKYSSADDSEVDIAKGQERVNISLVNEINSDCPPSFHYIHQNVVFQNAYMNFSLARIGDDNCCLTCLGNCLLPSTPCVCAHETGGEFAYTLEGLVKEEFLEECVSMNRDPQKHCQFYCKECPLERSKNEDIIEPCKGHLMRKFIKECWWKCGCNKQCGNRVVQRGINRKLQVFMTPGGKGWGLRTLEELPKGAFVCEYVGEVLTNAELFDRVSRSPKKEDHAYPVLLDADWGSEGVLKDEEALCLDATYYGNVARFINHRCFDSNMVEIPVEVETPDHHYYHLAFFTTRKVEALEELTWDYGIDFDDHDHPVKAFRCRCGSKFCRNIKRSTRSRSSARR